MGFGGWSAVDVDEAAWLRATVDRHRNLDRIAGLRRPGKLEAAMTAYTDSHRPSLSGRARGFWCLGHRRLVEARQLCAAAAGLPDFEFHLVHLVRRSHGVAHSWSRRVLKPGVGDGSSFMSVRPPYWAVGLWIADNLLYDIVARQLPRTTRVRYEDMIADPRAELQRILGELELSGRGPGVRLPGRARPSSR